jgi:quercetin dioxygenase-like cupin family protein
MTELRRVRKERLAQLETPGMNRIGLAFFTIVAFGLCVGRAGAEGDNGALGATTALVLKSNRTADGEALKYPEGASPEITAAVVTLEPGGRTALHEHPTPVVAYILEGTLTVKEEGREPRTYKAGDSFLETVGHWHQGFNAGKTPVKILAVFLGQEGRPTTVLKN